MSTRLPRSRPSAQDVDPAALLAFVEAVDADPDVELHSLMVLRHGHVVAEGWWAPHTPERTRLLYSLSKSFTSAALGFALQEGLVGLDDTVVSHFPEYADEVTDRRTRSLTLRHVASMASGHTRDMVQDALADPRDPVRGFLLSPPEREPGTVFAYNQPCTYTLASVLQRAAGMPLSAYLRPRLLDPLGIGEVGWLTWPPGREQGFSGLFARTEDVAKLGELFLRRGRWDGTQLLSPEYVDLATAAHLETHEDNADWQQGYGFQFWRSRHGYRGDGAFGQFCVVLPEQDMVVATTGGTEAMQAVLDHLWSQVLPGVGTAGPGTGSGARSDADAEHRLEERLSGLRLPACRARPEPARWEDWAERSFVVTPATGGEAPLRSVEVRRSQDGPEVTVVDGDDRLTIPVGATDWRISEPRNARGDAVPVAASGGWTDDGTLRVELVALESPHRMDITCTLPGDGAEAAWRIDPLGGGRLGTLHRPR